MKVLLLSNNPERASFKQRFAVYFDILKENNILCDVWVIPSNLFSRWSLFKKAQNYNGVILHKKGLRFFDAFILKKYSRKIIFNYDDAVMFKDSRPDSLSKSHYIPFKRSVSIADNVLVGSEYLASFAQKLGANVKILPLGLESDKYYCDLAKVNDGKIRLVWIGSESTLCYLESLKNVLNEIGKEHKNVVLRIIGDTFFDLENMEIEKFKWSADKRAEYLSACDIGLAPLPANNFTRGKCSFKVLEYASAKLPVVASDIGTNSTHLLEGKSGFIAKSPADWKKHIETLIENKCLRNQMGQLGYEHAQNYSLENIGKQLVDFISSAL